MASTFKAMRILTTPNAKFDELLCGDIEVTIFSGRCMGEVMDKDGDTQPGFIVPQSPLIKFKIPKEKRELIAMFFKL